MLRLTDLRKSFGPIAAVDGVSLEVHRGEVFGLLGPNGAGKSTTISMAVGLLAPDSGSVDVNSQGPPTSHRVRAHIGVATQALAIYDQLTGLENLRMFGRLYGLSGTTLAKRVEHALDLVGLLPRAKDLAGGYSGGMKRRLNLAAALIHDPPLLLLDEPTAGVDPQSRNNILDTVRELAKQGRTIIYTTHYMEEAQRLCDRVGIIDKGRLLCVGTVDELVRTHGGTSLVRVSRGEHEDAIETDDPLRTIETAITHGRDTQAATHPITGIRIDRPDLESVFLALTGRRLRD
ncbi:MAG: ABC transporter ATP-binding protein [Phycisphaerales bacterium]|nr:ABC transporter ATP-binding protein [Phycisphaerales bacterium]